MVPSFPADETLRWPLQNRHKGKTFFELERVGAPSRWNTLRALRVLKWWESEPAGGSGEQGRGVRGT